MPAPARTTPWWRRTLSRWIRREEEWAPTLRRSVRLLREFGFEQEDPARFYGAIADDSVEMLRHYDRLEGQALLDVGGGPGYFKSAFEAAGMEYFSVDVEDSDLPGAAGNRVLGSGMQLPFRSGAFDVAYSSNVLEHVPDPWLMASEMLRVVKPGGLVFISYTVWYGPWGGHETSPHHYLGGMRARRRYARKHGHEPKNRFGESMFGVTVSDGLRWSRRQDGGEVVDVFARYNPGWSQFLLRIPLLREVTTWNLVIVLRRR
ncbi:MAG: class I SAM-dependent methyltransferase [Nocardioides sp.]|nr:class I SAM-dependent methyltransferase [Nocardioides sp.]